MGADRDAVVREVVDRLAIRYNSRSNYPPTRQWWRPWREQPGWDDFDPTDELDAVPGRTSSSKAEVCDAAAKVLALGFADRTLTFEFCDRLVSYLFAWIVPDVHEANDPFPVRGFPELFMRIYEAFEEGEYIHEGDSPEIDFAEKYARPEIAAVIRDLSLD